MIRADPWVLNDSSAKADLQRIGLSVYKNSMQIQPIPSSREQRIYDALGATPKTVTELVIISGISRDSVVHGLLSLTLVGRVRLDSVGPPHKGAGRPTARYARVAE